jgi:hypothetical protein
VEGKLTGISSMLTHAGRLQLVNIVLSSLPTDFMWSVQVPVEVLEYVDKARRNCMWRKSESNGRSQSVMAWRKCTRPKRKGGLGVINLRSQNVALLLKHLDKFYNRRDIPWVNMVWNTYYPNEEVTHATKKKVSFWWRDILKLSDMFRGITICKVGNGTSVMFWLDVLNEHHLRHKFSRLYSYAKNKNISIAKFLLNNNINDQFHLPLSLKAFQEYQELQQLIQQIQLYHFNDSWHLGKHLYIILVLTTVT